jgi:hypothetical protein
MDYLDDTLVQLLHTELEEAFASVPAKHHDSDFGEDEPELPDSVPQPTMLSPACRPRRACQTSAKYAYSLDEEDADLAGEEAMQHLLENTPIEQVQDMDIMHDKPDKDFVEMLNLLRVSYEWDFTTQEGQPSALPSSGWQPYSATEQVPCSLDDHPKKEVSGYAVCLFVYLMLTELATKCFCCCEH